MEMIHLLEKRAANLKQDVWNRMLGEPEPAIRRQLEEAYNRLHDAQVALETARIEAR